MFFVADYTAYSLFNIIPLIKARDDNAYFFIHESPAMPFYVFRGEPGIIPDYPTEEYLFLESYFVFVI
jgi:hypothetical protein